MKAIMKSQLYQLKKERLIYIVFALCIALLMIFVINESDQGSFGEILCDMSSILSQISLLFLISAVAVICGKDFVDKTGNYEIMTGHTRFELYFGRAFLSIVIGVLGSLLICFIIIGIGCAIFGWGDAVSFGEVILRIMLLFFPMFRVACETIFLTFIIRNCYMVLAAGYVYLFFVVELIMGVSVNPTSFYLGVTNMVNLLDMTSFSTYSPVHPTKTMVVYDATLNATQIGGTIVVSLIVGVVFLVLGFHFFKTDDIE